VEAHRSREAKEADDRGRRPCLVAEDDEQAAADLDGDRADIGGSGSLDDWISAIVPAWFAILLRPLTMNGKPINRRPTNGR
jgi:hypothetical protein